jgi:hypothetical protein
MARVLVAHADEAVRDALAMALADVAGHLVLATSDGQLSVAALRLTERPMVALMDERLLPFSAIDILRIAANDSADEELSRHRYILMSTEPANATVQWQSLLTRLHVPVLALPVELDELIELVDDVGAGHNPPDEQRAGGILDDEHRRWDAFV